MRRRVAPWFALLFLPVVLRAGCVNFPPAFVPFSTIDYVTAANSAGDHLVVGALAGGLGTINVFPLPSSPDQVFCGSQVQLAPQQFFSNIYVPSAAERAGIFTAFTGLLLDPLTNQPFPNGVIPATRLGPVYAFRIGPAQPAQAKTWSPTGSMAYPRYTQAAVLLPSGKVLVVGGCDCPAELYDPSTGTFSLAGPPSSFQSLSFATATLLQDGRVLITGGIETPSAAEIYDPVAGQYSALPAMVQPHGEKHTATLLNDGRVLIVGGDTTGSNAGFASSGAEVFNPATGTFSAAGPMSQNRSGHTATLLSDGRVLVAGGFVNVNSQGGENVFNSAEIFDPSQGTFSLTGSMSAARRGAYAVLLPSGKVLVGGNEFYPPVVELFDPASGRFSVTGTMVAGYRPYAEATLLSNGQVLVSGGYGYGSTFSSPPTSSSELYLPASGTFTPAGNMSFNRDRHSSTLLPDGRVLVAGGTNDTNDYSSAELYTPVTQGLVTSQTGVTFRVAPNSTPQQQTVDVLSPTTSIPWNLSVKTYSGGTWLTATPSGATSDPTSAPTPISIQVNPAGLTAGDYYGAVTLTPSDRVHPPVSITVVFSIVPAGAAAPAQVSPAGLVFVATSGVSAQAQSFTISNVTSTPLTFTATGASNPSWFTLSATSGTVTTAVPATLTVNPASASLAAGVYEGSITLAFSDSSSQTVTLLLVVQASAPAAPSSALQHDSSTQACVPTKLVPVLTSVGTGFSGPAAWPVAIITQILDDCGSAVDAGTVTASFTNGDPPISLVAIGSGTWSGTWVPGPSYPNSIIRVDAQTLQPPPISGNAQVSVGITSNPQVPVVTPGGVVSSGDYASSPALGLLVSIFGSGLADEPVPSTTLPLPRKVGTTGVTLSDGEELPLLYVSNGQINALIPYEATPNFTYQLVVQRDNAISVPVAATVFKAAPAILSTAGDGLGQGHIYVADSHGNATLANKDNPAQAGDVVVIYCVGLGPVTPPVTSGTAAPVSPLSRTSATVSVSFGGQVAKATFAGLTPNYAGLYQVNVGVPAGVTPGNQVPISISVGGTGSTGAIFMAIK